MKKAATKTTAVTLGTKRTCPKCALKFYDFSRPTIQCPKCGTEVDPESELQVFRKSAAEAKKSKSKGTIRDDEDEVVVTSSEDTFESVDDLSDDDDESLEGIATGETEDSDDT